MALIGVMMHAYYMPYRQESDNNTAILAQGLIFAWTFVFVMRNAGALPTYLPSYVVGTVLLLATLGTYAHALSLTLQDLAHSSAREHQDDITVAENDETNDDNAGNRGQETAAARVEAGEAGIEMQPTNSLAKETKTAEDADDENSSDRSSVKQNRDLLSQLKDAGSQLMCGELPAAGRSEIAGNGRNAGGADVTALQRQVLELPKELAQKDGIIADLRSTNGDGRRPG